MVFAVLSELIELGADHRLCVDELTRKVPLSQVRLKSIIFKKLLLKKDARLAVVSLDEEDFEASGASWSDVAVVAKELLNLAHVQEVEVTKSDEKDKIIKLSKEV
jgi:nanoRNase/pAp phosphatase (c-di-AMP/oligoRNAs hydrolase)